MSYAEYATKYLWLKVPIGPKSWGAEEKPIVFGLWNFCNLLQQNGFSHLGKWSSCLKLSKAKRKEVGSFLLLLIEEIRPSPVELGSFSPLFTRCYTSQVVCQISSINSIIDLKTTIIVGFDVSWPFRNSPFDNLVRTLRGAWVSLYPKSLQHCWYVAWQGSWIQKLPSLNYRILFQVPGWNQGDGGVPGEPWGFLGKIGGITTPPLRILLLKFNERNLKILLLFVKLWGWKTSLIGFGGLWKNDR